MLHFVYPFVGGHMGCFYLLAIMSNVAMVIGDKYVFETLLSVLLGIYLGVELLDHMVIVF